MIYGSTPPNETADVPLPIDAYGAIGNDDRCVLVGQNGSIDWCCFPHLESPSVFAAILDPETGGRFQISPSGSFDSRQSYVDATNVLRTTFETDNGTTTVTDFMPVREGESPDERFQQSIYRLVEGDEGTVELEATFEPRFDYGRAGTAIELEEGDIVASASEQFHEEEHRSSAQEWPYEQDRDQLFLHTDTDFTVSADGESASAAIPINEGDRQWLCLQYGAPEHRSPAEYDEILESTIEYWERWLEGCEDTGGGLFEFDERWRDLLVRSALVLKLLIHEETGAIPAAPTTSLPEEFGGELNWDYRYNWVRDAKFTIQALFTVGQSEEAHRYFEWFREIGHDDPEEIQPLYGLHGESDLEEEILDHLSGYGDSRPVRIGNAAAEQEQLDTYGTIIQGIYETIRYEDGLSDYDWESIGALASYICDHWDETDKGIWEFRDLHEHFVHSKLLCWVGLDRAIRLADEYDRDAPIAHWDEQREAIREAIVTRGYDEERGTFLQYFDADGALDATCLLLPLYEFLPPEDERIQGTIDTAIEELTTEDGLVYRFANSPARPRESGGFLICSCWLVDALVVSDRIEEATEIFEQLREHAAPLGLLPEMIHAENEAYMGNYPQAFSHIGVLNSAIYLASATGEDSVVAEALQEEATEPLFRRHGS